MQVSVTTYPGCIPKHRDLLAEHYGVWTAPVYGFSDVGAVGIAK